MLPAPCHHGEDRDHREVNFGTATAPMVYYMMRDNDQLYSNTCEWGSTGTFCGLMVIMEACLRITGGDGITPCVVGAVFNGTPYKSGTSPSVYDIVLTGASSIAYDQAVIDAVSTPRSPPPPPPRRSSLDHGSSCP